ncbi:hypothetical protein JW865_03920 [Candidatus Bathyarchaeota archaeon]|nr:hypothetical protein [Candidatus Bathyarchaeota archaeon]
MSEQTMKEMAELLRKGAKMLSISCPECSSPLFQMKNGEIYCSKCKKNIKIVDEKENIDQLEINIKLQNTILEKIKLLEKALKFEEDLNKINDITTTISYLLDILKKINEFKK